MDQAGFRDWLCRRLVTESRDAIIFADQEGVIRLWNAGAEAMFGYRAAEMEGRSLDRIIPEVLRARHNEGYRRVMAEGQSRYAAELLAVPGIGPETADSILRSAGGLPSGVADADTRVILERHGLIRSEATEDAA